MRVFACLATSLDGHISPAHVDKFTRISSTADMLHLQEVRSQADVSIFGAETFRTYPREHTSSRKDHTLTHIIMSRSVMLDWTAPLFAGGAPVIIATPLPRSNWPGAVPAAVRHFALPDSAQNAIETLLKFCRSEGFENILVEGGGHILEQFLAAGALDELYLTVAPILIGDQSAPTLIPGQPPLPAAVAAELLDLRSEKGDLFLHYRIHSGTA